MCFRRALTQVGSSFAERRQRVLLTGRGPSDRELGTTKNLASLRNVPSGRAIPKAVAGCVSPKANGAACTRRFPEDRAAPQRPAGQAACPPSGKVATPPQCRLGRPLGRDQWRTLRKIPTKGAQTFIQDSKKFLFARSKLTKFELKNKKQHRGIEPLPSEWKPEALPLHQCCAL